MQTQERLWNKNFIFICIAYFLFSCAFYLLMPTIPIYLSEKLNISASRIGIVLSSYTIALLLIRPFTGYWVDIYARKPLLLFGVGMFMAVFIGYYFAFTVLSFILIRFVHGLFWGLSTVSANTVAIDIIPPSKRAEGIGYFGVTSNVAMAIAPYVATIIYDEHGFNALLSTALGIGVCSLFAIAFVKTKKRTKRDNITTLSFDRFILVKALPIMGNQLFLSFGWGTLLAFAVLYGKESGIYNSGLFFLFLAGGIVLSRVSSGKFVDKGYLHQVMMIALSLITIGFVGFALLKSIYWFCIAAFLIGMGYGTLFPALQTLYINMAPASKRGTANSTYLTGFDLGIGLGMLLGAYFADEAGFSHMYLVVAGLCFIAILLYWFNSRRVYEKYKLIPETNSLNSFTAKVSHQ